jgi:hypothetical protein
MEMEACKTRGVRRLNLVWGGGRRHTAGKLIILLVNLITINWLIVRCLQIRSFCALNRRRSLRRHQIQSPCPGSPLYPKLTEDVEIGIVDKAV